MDPAKTKKLLSAADKTMDPIGVLMFVVVYFLNKSGLMQVSVDEMFYLVIGAGATRSIYEGSKRQIVLPLLEKHEYDELPKKGDHDEAV